jgi:CRP-like cAMP-binding protein
MSETEIIDALERISLFSGLGRTPLAEIAKRVSVRRMPKLRPLFRKGEPCDGMWIVVEGQVRIFRANREGREQIVHLQGPGQSLAEVPLLDGGPYPAHARAEVDSVLLFLPRAAFESLYREEPEIADAIIRELGRRLRRMVGLVERISLRDVPSRVGLSLLEYARRAPGGGDAPFTLPHTQSEIAEQLATTRESVARALRTLREEGLIEQEGARVRIPDPEALEARCHGF